nr:reverse transcriptase domain-containing protein [Tanacetum cinerariifolium]
VKENQEKDKIRSKPDKNGKPWERFNDLLRACPHHGFFELHQLDTFYNALHVNDQDSLNSAAGGNFLDKMPRESLKIIESKSKVRQSRAKAVVSKVGTSSSTPAISSEVAELKDMVRALLLDKKTSPQLQLHLPLLLLSKQSSQTVITKTISTGETILNKTEEEISIILLSIKANFTDLSYVKANDAILRNMKSQGQNTQNQCQNIQNQHQNLQSQMATLTEIMSKFVNANTASSSGSGTLPGNTVTNPKEDLKGITTRSDVDYQGPKTPSPSKQKTKVTKDQVQNPSSQNTAPVQPLVIQLEPQALVSKPVVSLVSAPLPNVKPSIPYPSRRDNEKRRDQANEQIEKFYEIFKEMSFEINFTDALILMPKFASTLKSLIENKEKLNEMARTTMNEHCSAAMIGVTKLKMDQLILHLWLMLLQALPVQTLRLLDSQQSDKSKTGLGYDSQGFDSIVLENQENDKTSEGYRAIPLRYTRNFIPHKPDLVLADAHVVSDEDEDEIETESMKIKPSFAKVKFVKPTEHVKFPKKSIKK